MCKEMKWADGQIDIRKPYSMRLLSFLQYLYFYMSLFICSSYTHRRIQQDSISRMWYDLPNSAPTPPPLSLQKKKAKRQKSDRT